MKSTLLHSQLQRLCCVLFLLLNLQLTAQSVNGVVLDEKQMPLPGANVVLKLGDEVVQGTTTDFDGAFLLEAKAGTYTLYISFLGYEELNRPVVLDRSQLDLGKIALQPSSQQLAEVTVEVEASTFSFEQDKRVYNVGAELVNKGLNASDILNNIPSVSTDVDGNVSLRGSNGVRILINGKPSGLIGSNPAEALRLLQGSLIERIEVITNPSARYDAEGQAGIINIVLKKQGEEGFNGSFEVQGGYPDFYGASAALNYRTEKINFFGNMGINYRNSPGGGSSFQEFFGDTVYSFSRDRRQMRGGTSGTFNFGLDYYFNPKTSITTSFLYRPSLGNNIAELDYEDFNANGERVELSNRLDDEIEKERTLEGDLRFERQFGDNDKHKWTIDLKYQDSDDRESSNILQTSTVPADNFTQSVDNQEDERNLLFQSDYVRPLGGKTSFELGTRNTFREVLNNFQVRQGDSVFGDFSSNFQYLENIMAAYAIYNGEWEKNTYQIGLRTEYTDIQTAVLDRIDEPIEKNYINFFPSLFFTHAFSKTRDLQLSYSRRLNRPGFRSLLPFSNFSDNRNLYRGNPDLDPEFTDSYEIGMLNYWTSITLYGGFYYRHTTGVTERIITVDNEGVSTFLPVNLSVQDAYGLELTYSHELKKWWKINANLNVYNAITIGSFEGIDYGNRNFTAQGRLSSQTDFWGSTLQLNANLRAPQTTAQGRQRGIYTLDLAWNKDFWNRNASLTFSITDVFNSRVWSSVNSGPGFRSDSNFQWRQRQFLLTFSYRIKQQKKKNSRAGGGFGDEDAF